MKKVILTEAQIEIIKNVENKKYPYSPDKVLIVKKYLDNNFKKDNLVTVNADGSEALEPVFYMIGKYSNEITQQLDRDLLIGHLEAKWPRIESETDRRRKFLGQVVDDWYNNKIGLYGSLSVNHL